MLGLEGVHNLLRAKPGAAAERPFGPEVVVYKIGGKMFAVIGLDPASDHCMSFKCTPEQFAELVERNGIVPAPYVARYHWVALESFDALGEKELKALLRNSYELVIEKLPKKMKAQHS